MAEEKAEELSQRDMWATEYDGFGSCEERTPLRQDETPREDDRLIYPRLVRRDGESSVKLYDQRNRSSCCKPYTLSAMFHTMLTMPTWQLVCLFILSFVVSFLFFGFMVYIEDQSSNDVHNLDSDLSTTLFYVAYTMTTVGYGDTYPKNSAGSILPLLAVLCQIAWVVFWSGLIAARFMIPAPLAHTLLYSSRAVVLSTQLVRNQRSIRQFRCRIVNLRNQHPWVHTSIVMYYASFDYQHARFSFKPMPIDNTNFLFMDLPWDITHEISSESPLAELSLEQMVAQRGEIIVEVEGHDPITGNGIKLRFSYVASEIFNDHTFFDCVAVENDGYVVNLVNFHKTQSLCRGQEDRAASLSTKFGSSHVKYALGHKKIDD
eukprot:TRINITY_DN15594_c0_g1_i2.p1 TRINITY_DN15594_c0_g1~~TRINITY_DN15594_c0_g1_i2.p1  ORF type:complete len:376 (-),score=78.21 TRINITY_DN15594_c0_g1_i2:89-1216(-)